MAIPITYNVRNLRMRLGATAMTALGIALTVAIAIFIMALLAGLKQAFTSTGDPLNVMALRKGSDTELTSVIDRPTLPVIKFLSGVAKDDSGQPLASGEMIVLIVLPRKDGTGEVNVTVRGMSPIGFKLRPDIDLAEGRWFQPGQREVVVSRSVNQRFSHAKIGDKLHFGKGDWDVVGIFDSRGGSAHDSEIWGDVNQMATDFDRPIYNSILIRAADVNAADALVKRMSDDQRLKLDGMHESAYYGKQTRSGAPIKFIGTVIAIIMAIGSCFAAMNTMYASVAFRSREIATLRILGFSRPSILTCFVLESLLISLLGGLAAVLMMMPFNGLTTGTSNQATFSEVIFQMRITADVVISALIFAAVMGVIGGLAPAWHASRQSILAALRD
jgi:putative ABC transport system permease protein